MFYGNGIFRDPKTGGPVLPDNAITQRMRQGIFGPMPNSTAPPNFMVAPSAPIDPNDPAVMAAALRSSILPNIAGGAAAPKPAAAAPSNEPIFLPDRSW